MASHRPDPRRLTLQLAANWPDLLDDQRTIFIRPDVVHVVRRKPVAVLDAKYKLEDASSGYPNADVYQMLAYCTMLSPNRGWLVYAQEDASRVPEGRGLSREVRRRAAG